MSQGTTKGIPIDRDLEFISASHNLVPSQLAVKTYADTKLSISATSSMTVLSSSFASTSLSASYAPGSPSVSSSYSITSSFSLNSNTSLSSSYVTSSNVFGVVPSASYALNAPNIATGSSYSITSSWSTSSISSSYSVNSNTSLSASYVSSSALFGTIASSSYSSTASVSLSSSNATYSTSGSYSLNSRVALSSSYVSSSNVFGTVTSASYSNTSSYLGIGSNIYLSASYIIATTGAVSNPPYQAAMMFWDDNAKTYAVYTDHSGVTLQIGQESWMRSYAGEYIPNGSVVYITSSLNELPVVKLALADGVLNGNIGRSAAVGVATEEILSGSIGIITTDGQVHDLNTFGFSSGQSVFLSHLNSGSIISYEPPSPFQTIHIASVIKVHSTDGIIQVGVSDRGIPVNSFVGMVSVPTIVTSSAGSISIGTGSVNLCTSAEGAGIINNYTLQSASFSINTASFLDASYIVATYNGGTPVYRLDVDKSSVDSMQTTIVYSIIPGLGGNVEYTHWDAPGTLLANKVLLRMDQVDGAEISDGFSLSVSSSNYPVITSGSVWLGSSNFDLAGVSSSTNKTVLLVHSASVFSGSLTPQLTNTLCDNGVNVVALGSGTNHWVANYIYRSMTNIDSILVTYGQDKTSLADAQGESPAYPPASAVDSFILIGRIIYKKGVATPVAIEAARTSRFSSVGITTHNFLDYLQGGTTDEYYHLTATEYGATSSGSFLRQSSSFFQGTSSVSVSSSFASNAPILATGSRFFITSSWATSSISSSYALNAGTANTSSYVSSSGVFGTIASASYSSTASVSLSSSNSVFSTSSSYAANASTALSASYITSSNIRGTIISSSFSDVALSASYAPSSPTISASYSSTASVAPSYLPLTGGNVTGSLNTSLGINAFGGFTGSLFGTASVSLSSSNATYSTSGSYSLNSNVALSSSYVAASNVFGTVDSSSYAASASAYLLLTGGSLSGPLSSSSGFNGKDSFLTASSLNSNILTLKQAVLHTGSAIRFINSEGYSHNLLVAEIGSYRPLLLNTPINDGYQGGLMFQRDHVNKLHLRGVSTGAYVTSYGTEFVLSHDNGSYLAEWFKYDGIPNIGGPNAGGLKIWEHVSLRQFFTGRNIYNYYSYTDASNYQGMKLSTDIGDVTLAADSAGTGADDLNIILTTVGTGSVGIGTTSPGGKLHISGDQLGVIIQQSVGGSVFNGITFKDYSGGEDASIKLNQSSGEVRYLAAAGGYFPTFYSNNVEVMRISAGGNVGIGTTGPGYKLHVVTSSRFQGPDGGFTAINTGWSSTHGYTSSDYGVKLGAGGNFGIIQVSEGVTAYPLSLQPYGGNVGIGTNSPTEKLHVSGSVTVTGSLNTSLGINAFGGFTGSLSGTIASSSYALSASYAPGSPSVSASYASTASVAPLYLPLIGGTISSSITGSSTASLLTLNQVWDTTGLPTTLKLNVTDTASDASSLLMDLQLGGTSKFKVYKSGYLTTATGMNVPGLSSFSGGIYGANVAMGYHPNTVTSMIYGFTGGSVDSTDTYLHRDAVNVIAQRNVTNAQTFRVYGTYTDSNNYVRAALSASSTAVYLGSESAGTGADDVNIVLSPAGSGIVTAPAVVASVYFGNTNTGATDTWLNFSSAAARYGYFTVNSTTASACYEKRFVRTRGGSYDLDAGDTLGSMTWNTVNFFQCVANEDVASGFSCADFTWRTYNNVSVTAERMRLTAGGMVGIGTNIGATLNGMFHIVPNAVGTSSIYVKGITDYSGDAFHYANSSGTMLAKITSGGGIHGQVITIGGNACGISPSSVSGFLEISTGQGIKLNSGAAFCAIFNSSGNVGIGTTAPDKVLEVNLGTTSAFRLTHNDSNGSATTYMDTTVSSSGQTKFMATGSAPSFTFVGNSTTLSGSVYTSVSSASLEVLGIESRTPAGSSGSINERTYQFRVATTGSEVVPIYIRQIPAETVMGFDIVVVSRRTGSPVASGSAEDAGFFKILSQYNNIGGVATIVGSDTLVYSQSSQGTWAASTSSDGSDGVLLNVTGAEVNDIIWHATVKTYSVVF